MKLTPLRLLMAASFVFVLLSVRPLMAANPSSRCETPQLFEAFKGKTTVTTTARSTGAGAGALSGFDPLLGSTARGNRCIDAARSELGATGTRLGFFTVLAVGVALILGWRPRRRAL